MASCLSCRLDPTRRPRAIYFSSPCRKRNFTNDVDVARGLAGNGRARIARRLVHATGCAGIRRNPILQTPSGTRLLAEQRHDPLASRRTRTKSGHGAGNPASIRQDRARDFFEYAGIEPERAQGVENAQVWYVVDPQSDLQVFRAGIYAATGAAVTPLKTPAPPETPLAVQEIETPHCDTIESLARLLNVPTSRTAKAVFYTSGDRIIFAVIRGDLQIDEAKVRHALNVESLRWATDDEISRVGAVPGYASPVGTRGATIVVDDSIANSANLVAGANKAGYHLLNTNVPRDYKPDVIADIALAREGDPSPEGTGALELVRGMELGKLTAPRALDANFLDKNGKAQKQTAVELELDLGAILLAHIATHRDDRGIRWSRPLAPYDVHVVALNADKPEVADALNKVNDAIIHAGLEMMLDDRNESAGVKFNDADLIGLPLRLTIGPKTVAQGEVEIKARAEPAAHMVALDALDDELNKWMGL